MSRFSYMKTGSSAISETVEPTNAFLLSELRLHLSAAGGAGNLVVSLDSKSGPAHDVVFVNQDMTSVVDLVWQPTRPYSFLVGDKLTISWANDADRTYGLEVVTL